MFVCLELFGSTTNIAAIFAMPEMCPLPMVVIHWPINEHILLVHLLTILKLSFLTYNQKHNINSQVLLLFYRLIVVLARLLSIHFKQTLFCHRPYQHDVLILFSPLCWCFAQVDAVELVFTFTVYTCSSVLAMTSVTNANGHCPLEWLCPL